MPRHITNITLFHEMPTQLRGRRGKDMLRIAANKLTAVLSGVERGTSCIVQASTSALTVSATSGAEVAAACTAGIGSGNAGTVGVTINGQTNNVSTGASDIITQGLIAAAINASSSVKVQYLVGATNLKATLTLASVAAGTTIDAAGFRFTAISGTTESGEDGEFCIGGTDTQDAASLCKAINRHPYASKYLFALNEAGVCHVFPKTQTAAWFTGPNAPPNRFIASASTVTVVQTAASAYCGIWSRIPGQVGNMFTVAAVGTGQSIENSNTRLDRGSGPSAELFNDNL